MTVKPPVVVELEWQGDLRFRARAGALAVELDGDGRSALSPVQSLAVALAGCMASDVVHILTKARHPPRALSARLTARRAAEDPHRILAVDLSFRLEGEAPPDRVQRAIDLSRQTYCSVWHSLRQDIEFTTSFEIG